MVKNYKVTVNGQSYDVGVEELGAAASPVIAQAAASSAAPAPAQAAAPVQSAAPAYAGAPSANSVKAPMPGTVLSIKVAAGQSVRRGDVLLILEAMKMENEICSPSDGTIGAIRVQAGSTVNTGDPMVDLS